MLQNLYIFYNIGVMNTKKYGKLQCLLDSVPAGHLVDANRLVSWGISHESFRDYVKRGWLKRVHRGVYRRPTPQESRSKQVDWKVCLISMQHIMRHDVHVGGMTALFQQGYEHHLRLGGNAPVWVYGEAIPNWLQKLPLDAPVTTRNTSLFSNPGLALEGDAAPTRNPTPWDWQLRMSSPERAVMEAMDELPNRVGFHELDMSFQNLTILRPKLLSELLASCRKIKVKRLFFVFADRHRHPWRSRLDPDDFNLGAGDRALVKGGKIHPRYRIVVPEDFAGTEVSDVPL